MRVLFSIVLAWSAIAANAFAGPLTYDVGVIHLDAEGSMPDYVVTGTITTNGTIGWLNPSDFVSWSISVDGPRPYTFHPGNPAAQVSAGSVYASLTTLETSGHFGSFWFVANENTLPNCSDCRQQLRWTSWPIGHVAYNYYDSADGDPSFAPAVANLGSIVRTTIATRVPEPLGSALTFLAAATLVIVCRRRHFKRVVLRSNGSERG